MKSNENVTYEKYQIMKVCTQCKHPGCVSMTMLSLRCPGSQ